MKMEQENKGQIRPTVLVCGNLASGKTQLIKAVCSEGTVPDYETEKKLAVDGLIIYETDVMDFIDARGIENGETAEEYLSAIDQVLSERRPNHPGPQYDFTWLCIDGSCGRVQKGDLNILKIFGKNGLAVITKADAINTSTLGEMIDTMEKTLPNEQIVTVSSDSGTGVSLLLQKTIDFICETIPESKRAAFTDAWKNYFSENDQNTSTVSARTADEYIYWAAGRAFAIALIQLPLADVGPLVVNEAYMIYRTGSCYGYALDQQIMMGFLGCLGGSIAGKTMASFIPFLKSPIAAGITYGVGCAAKAYFESGMSLDKKSLNEIFNEGKDCARKVNWKNVIQNGW